MQLGLWLYCYGENCARTAAAICSFFMSDRMHCPSLAVYGLILFFLELRVVKINQSPENIQ